jgi:hypothetical protein
VSNYDIVMNGLVCRWWRCSIWWDKWNGEVKTRMTLFEHARGSPYVHICNSVRRKSLWTIIPCRVNSDKYDLPWHAVELVNVTAARWCCLFHYQDRALPHCITEWSCTWIYFIISRMAILSDHTFIDFSFWGFVKDSVCGPLPVALKKCNTRFSATCLKIWYHYSPEAVAGGWISPWRFLSHSLHLIYQRKLISNKNWEEWSHIVCPIHLFFSVYLTVFKATERAAVFRCVHWTVEASETFWEWQSS